MAKLCLVMAIKVVTLHLKLSRDRVVINSEINPIKSVDNISDPELGDSGQREVGGGGLHPAAPGPGARHRGGGGGERGR